MTYSQADITVPYAVANFAEIRHKGYYYVDKTNYIPLLERYKAPVFLRPRRFGKSLLVSMLAHYYDRNMATQFKDLFGGTWIGEHPTNEHNQYLVVRYDFSTTSVASKKALDSSFDHVAALLASMPRLLLKFVVWFLKTLDYFGLLPAFLTDLSPFHGTVIFTSMGSLGIPPIVHHLYNFGNLPVFVAFGRKYRKVELDLQGKPVTRRYVDFVMNTDERIVDGFYYATVMKYFEKLLREPEQLDLPPEPKSRYLLMILGRL